MVEAQIICTCTSIQIRDLGLVMRKGQGVFIDEAKARASKDLEIARRSGGVQVHYTERFKESRPGTEEPQPQPPPAPPIPKKPVYSPQPVAEKMALDMDVLAEKVAEKMRSLRDPDTNRRLDVLTEQVTALLATLTGRTPQEVEQSLPASGKVRDDVPVFIPAGLVPTGKVPDLKALEGLSQGSVDDATEALRKLKRDRRR